MCILSILNLFSDKPHFNENRGNCKHNFIIYAYQSNNPPLNATGSKWCQQKANGTAVLDRIFFFFFA